MKVRYLGERYQRGPSLNWSTDRETRRRNREMKSSLQRSYDAYILEKVGIGTAHENRDREDGDRSYREFRNFRLNPTISSRRTQRESFRTIDRTVGLIYVTFAN